MVAGIPRAILLVLSLRYYSAKETAFVPPAVSTFYLARKALKISPFTVTPRRADAS